MRAEWIRKPESETSVVFVHGILSSGEACWLHKNGSYWPELLKSEPGLGSLGIYVFTYQTGIFSGSYRLGDIVDALKEHMRLDDVLKHDRLIFVCHSMGGIVVRKFIVERATELIEAAKQIGLFLVSSPSLGSSYADWLSPLAQLFGHAQADVLRFVRNNNWLQDLDKEFNNLKEAGKLRIKGKELVEDKFVYLPKLWGRQVVEPFSGARFFGESYKVPDSDHFSIAKPETSTAIQHRLLCQFIEDTLQASTQPLSQSLDLANTGVEHNDESPTLELEQSNELVEAISTEKEKSLKQRLRQHEDKLRRLSKREAHCEPGEELVSLRKQIEIEQAEVDLLNKVLTLTSKTKELHDDPLNKIEGEICAIEKKFVAFQQDIEDIYGRGQEFTAGLNDSLNLMKTKWQSIKQKMDSTVAESKSALSADFYPIRIAMSELLTGITTPVKTRPLIRKAEGAIQVFKAEVEKKELSINVMYADFRKDQLELEKRIATVRCFGDALFPLREGETLVDAAKAIYGNAEGRLFFTNKRLVFEQKELVVERSWGLINKGNKLVHEILLEKQLDEIKVVHAYKKRELSSLYLINQHYLHFEFVSEEAQRADFRLDRQNCDEWAKKIEMARARKR
jgi:hypothetical protein